MNGLTLLVLIVLAAGGFLLFRLGVRQGERQRPASNLLSTPVVQANPAQSDRSTTPTVPTPDRRVAQVDRRSGRNVPARAAGDPLAATEDAGVAAPLPNAVVPVDATAPTPNFSADEHARLVRTLSVEAFGLRSEAIGLAGEAAQLAELADDRHRLLRELADARGSTARYRQLVIDLENNAPPPLLTGAHALDDLKLVVGIGPMLERMLQQLGITTYRQIARWSERDIAEFDAKLPEFPGRIRRDEWVKQARALHQSKYGEILSARG